MCLFDRDSQEHCHAVDRLHSRCKYADFAMDMWSIACTIFELFSGSILFQGRDNNEMLRLIMELKGPFPKKMIKKGIFSHLHFAGVTRLENVLTL